MNRLTASGQEVKEGMTLNWSSMRAMAQSELVVRLTAVGAVAGVLAWLLVFALHVLFEVTRPSAMALLLAIPRGAVFGVIVAVILHAYWRRHPGKSEMKDP